MVYEIIDIETCANILSKSTSEAVIPLALGFGIFLVFTCVVLFLYLYTYQELLLLKAFIFKEKLIQKYAEWKKDRKL